MHQAVPVVSWERGPLAPPWHWGLLLGNAVQVCACHWLPQPFLLSLLARCHWQNHTPLWDEGSGLCPSSICPAASIDFQRPDPSAPTTVRQQEGGRLGPKCPGLGRPREELLAPSGTCHVYPGGDIQGLLGVPALSWCLAQRWPWQPGSRLGSSGQGGRHKARWHP